MILDIIQKEHVNMAALLKFLDAKLNDLKEDRSIRYDFIKDIIDYLHDYADKHHHPCEDLIYEYYLEKTQGHQDEIHQLAVQHQKISELTQRLSDMTEMILMDAVVPQQQYIDALSEFLYVQTSHLNYEEDNIIPMLREELTNDDWDAILKLLPYDGVSDVDSLEELAKKADPLFGTQVSERYKPLHQTLHG
ncbi:hemerythrin domain-containing protein [Echinimonas agarilytica]|uniref:Hemerythrin domain-containing protein n=1 Tax=Echinimonas agarilytica TaxID=1215918 RepID=A0AA41W930_9GAMM|nr:hemerythrin domain-containing protein [Echinimonas agarilytica]MCM2681350.1 hemerythrin domain-containing protein [Echinimonas agarilytica]